MGYGYTQNGGNNTQITSITDNVDAGRSVNYAYDALARLSTAVTTGSAAYPKWGLSWTGVYPERSRRDAENHAVTAAGATYTYDGNGLRVKKVSGGTTTVYVFSGTKVIAEYENGVAVTSPTREYIYSGSALLAKIEAGATTYSHADHLSTRLTTDSAGAMIAQSAHYPFGENWYETGGPNKLKFTSYERDSESGNDYAIFRYAVNRLGRFSSPDPLAGSLGDPQSLNRYAYVANDPVNLADPLGLRCIIWYNFFQGAVFPFPIPTKAYPCTSCSWTRSVLPTQRMSARTAPAAIPAATSRRKKT